MAPPASTRKALRQRIARRIYPNSYPVTSDTTGDGTTTTIVDSLLFPGSTGAQYAGAWIYMASIPTDSTPIGEISRIFSVDFNAGQSTSILIFSPALSILTKSGAEYEIHYKYHPSIIHNRIDEVLGIIQAPVILPLTLITDGDMEVSGIGNWTATAGSGGTSPTVTKDTTTVLHGRQSLKIIAAGDDTGSYAVSDSLSLPPNTTCIVAADVWITSGENAKLVFYDVTNSAEIDTAESAATGWVHLGFVVTTPATCEQVSIRLLSPTISDTTYWDHAIVLPINQASIEIPGSIEFSEEARKLFYFPVGTGLTATGDDHAYKLEEQPRRFWSHFTPERDETAVIPYRIEIKKRPISSTLWLEGVIDFPAFAGASEAAKDTDTTVCPADIVVEFVYALFLEDMAGEARMKGDFKSYTSLLRDARFARNDVMSAYRSYFPVKGVVIGASKGG